MGNKPVRKTFCTVVLVSLCIAIAGCGIDKQRTFSGRTMGTVYHITVVTGWLTRIGTLKKAVEKKLYEINMSMSTYIPDSEISRFNTCAKPGEPFDVSNDFLQVARTGRRLFELTGGAWDGTVWPLVRLWDFDRHDPAPSVPAEEEIKKVLRCVGYSHIHIDRTGRLTRDLPCVLLDFASIAKGYGVDAIAGVLKNLGVHDFIVEIGGEVYASGRRKDGKPWRIGINTPRSDASVYQVREVIELSDRAVATSGDYRNYFVIGGRKYSHVLDPRTGWPVETGVVSVSVVAGNCMFADGLATALMVMGPEKGIGLVNRLDNVECVITVRHRDGAYEDYTSAGMKLD